MARAARGARRRGWGWIAATVLARARRVPGGPRHLGSDKGVYRARELSREPLPMEKLRFSNEREERATRFLEAKAVVVQATPSNGMARWS